MTPPEVTCPFCKELLDCQTYEEVEGSDVAVLGRPPVPSVARGSWRCCSCGAEVKLEKPLPPKPSRERILLDGGERR